jgi:hypothetical protein
MALISCGGGVFVWQNKNPTAGWQWGSRNLVQSEPDRRAGKQRAGKQKVQIQMTVHGGKVVKGRGRVKRIDSAFTALTAHQNNSGRKVDSAAVRA